MVSTGDALALAGVAAGAAGLAACITLIYTGTSEMMHLADGSCGNTGITGITTHCVTGDVAMLVAGSFGLFVAISVLMACTSAVGGPAWATFALMFAGLGGALGADFNSYANHNILNRLFPGHGGNDGWRVGAYTWWAVAGGAAIVAVLLIIAYLKDALAPPPSAASAGPPIVEAAPVQQETAETVPRSGGAESPAPANPPLIPSRIVLPPRDSSSRSWGPNR
jgi:hypothetical protein